MADIDAFKAKVSQHKGFQDKNRYRVILPSIHIGDDVRGMDMFCRSVTSPGKNLNTFGHRTDMKEKKYPNGYSATEVNMTFTETADHMVARYFDFWLHTIVNPYSYLVEYKDFYARNVFIMAMNRQDEIKYGILLKKAYPSAKTAEEYTDNTRSTLQEVSVTFEYDDFEVVDHTLTGVLNTVIAGTRASILGIPLAKGISLARNLGQTVLSDIF